MHFLNSFVGYFLLLLALNNLQVVPISFESLGHKAQALNTPVTGPRRFVDFGTVPVVPPITV